MSVFGRFFSGERLLLEDKARAGLPGRVAILSDGATYYELGGPQRGNPVVLIHGFSVPSFIWDPTFVALSQAGFRTLRYDLFGRGYSDRPKARYDKALFVRQLAELLEALKFPHVDLVSLSMGGVVAAEFAFRFPKRVRELAFISPAGFDLELPWTVKLLKFPGLGEFVFGGLGLFGTGSILQSMFNDFHNPSQQALDEFATRYLEQMKYRGFRRAILSTLRNRMLDEDLDLFRRMGASEKPVLLVWGKMDQTVPFRHHETFRKLVPQTEFHAIEDAAHISHFEKPDLVNPILVSFLKR